MRKMRVLSASLTVYVPKWARLPGGRGFPSRSLCFRLAFRSLDPLAAGEQAVVADAVEAVWQDVNEEAADELMGCERHRLVSIAAFDPVVLPAEGDAVVVQCDQAAVGDGDAVGVTRQIGQYCFGTAERAF